MEKITNNNDNVVLYITILRQHTKASISEIRFNIMNQLPVFDCDLFDSDQVIQLRTLAKELIRVGAKLLITRYFGNHVDDLTMKGLDNIIEDQADIEDQVWEEWDQELQ